jgi:hypothetical protein
MMPNKVIDIFFGWKGNSGCPRKIDLYFSWKGKSGLIWIVAPLSLMWSERESFLFLSLKRSLYVWLLAYSGVHDIFFPSLFGVHWVNVL